MKTNLHNLYLFRAIEAYPYELEKTAEALNYALAYDSENVIALCLMAKLQSEQLGDYRTAKAFYEKAIASNMDMTDIYPDYSRLLVNNGDYTEAQKLIDFALTIKGIDKAAILLNQGYLFEALNEFEKAEEALENSKMVALNNDFIYYVDEVIKRVNKKRKIQNNKNRVKETQESAKAETSKTNWFQTRLNNLL
ncbi:tetratricopeptide repeat protein [Seonamhaeicola sediminis]|uniref:Tetratricopeptide repeat protein n=1 Tax=Seonamhaeicola sediminis TaxID=2528206 RepID=A0A562YG85_9FLAO|nr:tetratricopeptide repeat protein [Seonamhaeicola sediminis]TWO33887.1 tetratricopeptide repeat protein [Seonamhaeicola sediminis]